MFTIFKYLTIDSLIYPCRIQKHDNFKIEKHQKGKNQDEDSCDCTFPSSSVSVEIVSLISANASPPP